MPQRRALARLRQSPVGPNTYRLPDSSHGLRQRHEAGVAPMSPRNGSAELEQHAVAAARIAPLDIAAGLADHAAGAAFDAAVDRDLDLALVVELVAPRRTDLQQRQQRRRWLRVRANLDMGAAGIDQIAVVEQLVLDTYRELGRHVSVSIVRTRLKVRVAVHRHARAKRNASPNRPVHDRAFTNDRSVVFSLSAFGVPSTRKK